MEHLTNDERIILLDCLVMNALFNKVSELTGESIESLKWSVIESAGNYSATMSNREMNTVIAEIREDNQLAWNGARRELGIEQ